MIIHRYYTYINVSILENLSVYAFVSIDLALDRFTPTKGAAVPENYVSTCINKS